MRLIFTLITLLFLSSTLQAQEITGIWRGTFEQNDFNFFSGKFSTSTYKYEVQLNHLGNNSLEGVTYSYLNTVFYGKADLKGLYQKKGKTLVIKETKMLEMKAEGPTDPCLMTCYLDYKKEGDVETLSGTYTSLNLKTKQDCGSGTVYLERVLTSKFKKEDFLTKKEPNNNSSKIKEKKDVVKVAPVKPNAKTNPNFREDEPKAVAKNNINRPLPNNNNPTTVKPVTKPNNNLPKPKVKPGTEQFVVKKKDTVQKQETATIIPKLKEQPTVNPLPKTYTEPQSTKTDPSKPTEFKIADKPKVLEERVNKLANRILVDSKEVILEFYDNGQIDGDIITVFKNDELVVDKKTLSTEPITVKLKFDSDNTVFNIFTIAENLGAVPPNTALMVVTFGNKRQEIFLTSDNKTNALVVIEYNEAKKMKW